MEKLRKVRDLLAPLEAATQRLGGEKYVSASIALPELNHLLKLMCVDDDDPGYI